MPLSWRSYIWHAVITVSGFVLALAWFYFPAQHKRVDEVDLIQGDFFRMTEFTQTLFGEGGMPEISMTADDFRIAPRRLGIFTIWPVFHSVIRNARIKRYLDGEVAQTNTLQLGRMARSLLDMPYSKVRSSLKTVVIEGVELLVYGKRHGSVGLSVKARRATVDLAAASIAFNGVVVEDNATGRKIQAKKMIWAEKSRQFLAKGWYRASSPKGTATGRGLAIDLLFNLSPLPAADRG